MNVWHEQFHHFEICRCLLIRLCVLRFHKCLTNIRLSWQILSRTCLLLMRFLFALWSRTNCPMQGNPDSEIRENFACKIRNIAQGIRNPTVTVIEPRFTDTRLIRTPRYYGQFSLSQGKALAFSLNSTRLIRTPSVVPSVSVLTVFDCTYDCNSESKFHGQGLESSSWNPESTACNPESKTVLNSLTWGETKASTKREWLVTTRERTSRERGCGYEPALGLQQRLPDLQNAAVCTCERLNTCPVCGNNRWKMQLSFISLIITKW